MCQYNSEAAAAVTQDQAVKRELIKEFSKKLKRRHFKFSLFFFSNLLMSFNVSFT